MGVLSRGTRGLEGGKVGKGPAEGAEILFRMAYDDGWGAFGVAGGSRFGRLAHHPPEIFRGSGRVDDD